MHGIILQTLQSFVVDTYGEDAWLAIQNEADIEEKVYVPVTVYPDGDVYEIARTAGDLTDQSPRTILTQYGRWVVPALLETYDLHIDDDWEGLELIANIQRFHTSLRTRDMTTLTTPRIRSERVDENRVRITYDSDRKLCDVARGAIQGVADRFDEDLVAEERTCMHEGDDACVFDIRRRVSAEADTATVRSGEAND
ncbi:Heme NO binding domain-containing protein [Natrinema pellirubrum DSM 15624]|uniref:Heme NO binding domain-containing protein n=1 Tax=Natrinema pellirubrum (strain DSM 15624 / CIP 106293 / JCM 10476 / NCIMB 786 / 157) TaxID=797303 RepID=L0JGE2_NATP1|nr:heme NO-binding domain-containing protein [Natrinema pellirubrum]AGB30610.1 heme NO binding protein [Natrinema pellirubrum DSM 15624]ELY74915.1 Heme NO binding domain-containing protein [Natrinema pellirubrum DSM 15624]